MNPVLVSVGVSEMHECLPAELLSLPLLLGMLWQSSSAYVLAVGFCLACPFTLTFILLKEETVVKVQPWEQLCVVQACSFYLRCYLNLNRLSKGALFACICLSKSIPRATVLLITHDAYLSLYCNVKQWEENSHSAWCVLWIPCKTQQLV